MAPCRLPVFATPAPHYRPGLRDGGRGALGDRTGSDHDHRDLVDLLTGLDAEVAGRMSSGALVAALRRWRARHVELMRYGHPDDLIRLSRAHGENQESKDVVLATLCAEGVGGDDDAAVMLMWLMLPSLLLARRQLAARSAFDPDELDAELLAGLWEAAARVRPGAPFVAKRLIDGARHGAFAAIRREENWISRIAPLGGEIEESRTLLTDAGEVPDILPAAVAASVISEVDAELFRASRSAIPQLRSRLGISENAVRSRRLRARRRLLEWLAGSFPLHSADVGGSPQEVPTDSPAPRATDGTQRSPL